ncbi:hypothetical protein MN608_10904 [Microdochium nivale]|nr:hypothetical protein MN608_10904 [Microdochium nivale]
MLFLVLLQCPASAGPGLQNQLVHTAKVSVTAPQGVDTKSVVGHRQVALTKEKFTSTGYHIKVTTISIITSTTIVVESTTWLLKTTTTTLDAEAETSIYTYTKTLTDTPLVVV